MSHIIKQRYSTENKFSPLTDSRWRYSTMEWCQHWLLAFSKIQNIPQFQRIHEMLIGMHTITVLSGSRLINTICEKRDWKEYEKKKRFMISVFHQCPHVCQIATMTLSQGKERWMASAGTPGFCWELIFRPEGDVDWSLPRRHCCWRAGAEWRCCDCRLSLASGRENWTPHGTPVPQAIWSWSLSKSEEKKGKVLFKTNAFLK